MNNVKSSVFGAQLETIADPAKWIEWLGDERAKPSLAQQFEPRWALAICSDGVTWGRSLGERWAMGSTAYPNTSPAVSTTNLQELRIFGVAGEALIWRTDTGLAGRLVVDAQLPPGVPAECLQPLIEEQIVLGDRVVSTRDGFTHVANAAGRQQVLPIDACTLAKGFAQGRSPLRLVVKHYLVCNDRTGCVRIALSRLVDIKVRR